MWKLKTQFRAQRIVCRVLELLEYLVTKNGYILIPQAPTVWYVCVVTYISCITLSNHVKLKYLSSRNIDPHIFPSFFCILICTLLGLWIPEFYIWHFFWMDFIRVMVVFTLFNSTIHRSLHLMVEWRISMSFGMSTSKAEVCIKKGRCPKNIRGQSCYPRSTWTIFMKNEHMFWPVTLWCFMWAILCWSKSSQIRHMLKGSQLERIESQKWS